MQPSTSCTCMDRCTSSGSQNREEEPDLSPSLLVPTVCGPVPGPALTRSALLGGTLPVPKTPRCVFDVGTIGRHSPVECKGQFHKRPSCVVPGSNQLTVHPTHKGLGRCRKEVVPPVGPPPRRQPPVPGSSSASGPWFITVTDEDKTRLRACDASLFSPYVPRHVYGLRYATHRNGQHSAFTLASH